MDVFPLESTGWFVPFVSITALLFVAGTLAGLQFVPVFQSVLVLPVQLCARTTGTQHPTTNAIRAILSKTPNLHAGHGDRSKAK
jgi:hypothetical protein